MDIITDKAPTVCKDDAVCALDNLQKDSVLKEPIELPKCESTCKLPDLEIDDPEKTSGKSKDFFEEEIPKQGDTDQKNNDAAQRLKCSDAAPPSDVPVPGATTAPVLRA